MKRHASTLTFWQFHRAATDLVVLPRFNFATAWHAPTKYFIFRRPIIWLVRVLYMLAVLLVPAAILLNNYPRILDTETMFMYLVVGYVVVGVYLLPPLVLFVLMILGVVRLRKAYTSVN